MNTKAAWLCDHCEQEIKRPQDGYVEWLIRKEDGVWKGRGLRLVHHATASPRRVRKGDCPCQYNEDLEYARDGSTVADNALSTFLGPDGLMRLLQFFHEGELAQDEILEMIKRLHIPGYEQARFHFDEALAADVFEPDTPPGFYQQCDIVNTLKYAKAQQGAGPS